MTRIRSVARAAQILLFLGEQPDGRTAKETALALALPVPTAYHLLGTLVAEGLLAKDSRRRYHLGPKVGLLCDAFLRQVIPPEYLLGPLHELAETTGETAYVVGWRNDQIVVLASVEGRSAVRVSGLSVGFQGGAHARASGKALLAFAPPGLRESYLRANPLERLTARTIVDPAELRKELARIRKRGCAVDEEEFRDGVACAAAPVLAGGTAIAAYSISAPASRFRRGRRELVEAVLASAEGVRVLTDASAAAASSTAR
jgi:IclR family transcriptional regulator, acetate operon repressor